MSFICHIHNYTEYNQQWNVLSAFNQSKCTHTWSSGQPTLRRPGSSWGFGALLKGLNSVVDNSCRSRDSNPRPRITSLTCYPLGYDCLHWIKVTVHCSWSKLTRLTWKIKIFTRKSCKWCFVFHNPHMKKLNWGNTSFPWVFAQTSKIC